MFRSLLKCFLLFCELDYLLDLGDSKRDKSIATRPYKMLY